MVERRSQGQEERSSGHFCDTVALWILLEIILSHFLSGWDTALQSWVVRGTESDPVGEQAHCAGQLGQVSKGEWNQPAASPPVSVRVSVLSPCSAQRGKASYGDPPLSLFDFLEFCGLGLVGGIEGGGRRQAELPLSASARAPSLCGPVWGFYSCEANIPGAHRASKIISHRRIAVLPNEKMMTWPPALGSRAPQRP